MFVSDVLSITCFLMLACYQLACVRVCSLASSGCWPGAHSGNAIGMSKSCVRVRFFHSCDFISAEVVQGGQGVCGVLFSLTG